MKRSPLIALAVTAGIVAATASTVGCSATSSSMPTTASLSVPAMSSDSPSATLSAPNSTSTTVSAAGPVPTTLEQLCDAQTWPRPVPDVVGKLFNPSSKTMGDASGALGCWDNIRAVGPNGGPPNNPARRDNSVTYRVTAVSPPPGTPIGRHDAVTVQLANIDSTAPPAFRPCDWVTTGEAASFIDGPVRTFPDGDQAGSVDMGCTYRTFVDSHNVHSELLVPGAFPVDAVSELALKTAKNATPVSDLGVKAACRMYPQGGKWPVYELFVLLNGDRLYEATGFDGESCDTLKQFAQAAIGRIGA